MSWNNVLPWWVIELEQQHSEASALCAFQGEWFAGTSRAMPDHIIRTSKATLASWEFGGWNYDYSAEEIKELNQLHNTSTARPDW